MIVCRACRKLAPIACAAFFIGSLGHYCNEVSESDNRTLLHQIEELVAGSIGLDWDQQCQQSHYCCRNDQTGSTGIHRSESQPFTTARSRHNIKCYSCAGRLTDYQVLERGMPCTTRNRITYSISDAVSTLWKMNRRIQHQQWASTAGVHVHG